MAPVQKGSKRAAACAVGVVAAPASKKANKKISNNSEVEVIQNVLRNKVVDLPEAVCDMLVAMVPGSLGTALDDRHKHQEACVVMIEGALSGVKERIAKSLAEEDGKVTDAVNQKAALEAKVVEIEGRLEKSQEAVANRKTELAEATRQFDESKSAVAGAAQAQREGDADIEVAKAEREQLESVIDGALKAVKEGTWETDKDAKQLVAKLLPVAKQIGLDASLITAMPSACAKKPDVWGSFDAMVMQQLEQGLKTHSENLAERMTAAAPAAEERAASLATAQASQITAAETMEARGSSMSLAQSELREVEASLTDAKKAKKAFVRVFGDANRDRDSLLNEMKEFERDLAVVESLKTRVSARRQKELDAEMVAAAAAEETVVKDSVDVQPTLEDEKEE